MQNRGATIMAERPSTDFMNDLLETYRDQSRNLRNDESGGLFWVQEVDCGGMCCGLLCCLAGACACLVLCGDVVGIECGYWPF